MEIDGVFGVRVVWELFVTAAHLPALLNVNARY
jgi:hypothetical protein